jgi:hypothetical protein
MSIYWVTTYYIVQEKASEYQNWLKSDRAKELSAEFEKETGFKYLDTYFPILGFGKYDCEDWFVAPDWSSFDKIRTSKASEKMMVETWDFIDQTRPTISRVMRTAQEVMISKPEKEK